jgi:hypothetical protein
VTAARDGVVARRYAVDALEECPLVGPEGEAVEVDGLAVPARRNTELEQGLHLGGEQHPAVAHRVEERLDPEAVTDGQQRPAALVGDHQGELTT